MAELIEWQNHLDLGIAPLDHQHRELADMLNHLAGRADDTAQDHARELQRVHDYARHHFLYEEQLMQSIGFRSSVQHQREHIMLLGELKSLINAIAAGRARLDRALLQSLHHWLIAHIVTSDREFAGYYLQTRPHAAPPPE